MEPAGPAVQGVLAVVLGKSILSALQGKVCPAYAVAYPADHGPLKVFAEIARKVVMPQEHIAHLPVPVRGV